jgi:hypothetical protein
MVAGAGLQHRAAYSSQLTSEASQTSAGLFSKASSSRAPAVVPRSAHNHRSRH